MYHRDCFDHCSALMPPDTNICPHNAVCTESLHDPSRRHQCCSVRTQDLPSLSLLSVFCRFSVAFYLPCLRTLSVSGICLHQPLSVAPATSLPHLLLPAPTCLCLSTCHCPTHDCVPNQSLSQLCMSVQPDRVHCLTCTCLTTCS